MVSCKESDKKTENPTPKTNNEYVIVIHGGAGVILKENLSAKTDSLIRAKLSEAIMVGHDILKNGGSSLDAVEKTINVLEDSPLFNAGKGAVFTNEETNEMDASIMTGQDLNAGAVAGIKTVKNPISAARKVMENSPHVMLSGKGADTFSKELGLEIVDPSYFFTENRFESLKRIKARENQKTSLLTPELHDSKFGTVGCVALDKNGNIAAGTSTGGMTNKKWNRIGDTPIIGAGTYANNKTCGILSTGHGEFFIRANVAHDISALMEYKGLTLQEAAREVIQHKLKDLGGDGGIIALDKEGNIVMEFNTPGMYRAYADVKGTIYTGIYKDE